MSEVEIGKMYGFEIANPPDILGHGMYRDSPNPTIPLEVFRSEKSVKTTIAYDHHSGLFDAHHYMGSAVFFKQTRLTLSFHWEALYEMTTEDIADETTKEFTQGISDTKDDVQSFTRAIGGEVGAEGKGMSAKLSASLSETNSQEHSVTITESQKITRKFTCPPFTTTQYWQLIATFTHFEEGQMPDLGHSIDSVVPPFNPGTRSITVRTNRVVSRSKKKKN